MSDIFVTLFGMARKRDAQQLELQMTPSPRSHLAGANRRVGHAPAAELLKTPGALLTRTHLRQLGLERRAVDAIFRALPVVALPGYSRPLVRAEDYVQLVERSIFRDDRVRPSGRRRHAE
jgi:hypothetical protein